MAKTVSVLAPMTGEVIPMSEIPDPVFSGGKLGKGFGVNPTENTVISPISGKVTMVVNTKHAVGIKAENGLEFLLHLGVDTVELDGAPFEMLLEKGQSVEAGQRIASMDLAAVRAAGKDTAAILAITNTPKLVENIDVHTGLVSAGEPAAEVILKGEDAGVADSGAIGTSAGAAQAESTGATSAEAISPSAARPANLTGYDALAWDILNNIGGKENVKSVIHCITRVRFYLKDDSKANDQVVSNLDGVIDVARAGGQYQVVIGPAVEDVYDAVVRQIGNNKAGGETESEVEPAERPTTVGGWFKWGFSSLIGVITGSMMPVIGLLAASGVLKGILTILTYYELVDKESQTFTIINAMGDAVFYFLPIFVGFTAARRLGADPIIVSIIGGVLAYPTINAISQGEATGSILGISTNAEFFGLPFPMASYTYSIFPHDRSRLTVRQN
ncbi:glucose PTS transporter subunit IIA [uncultured Rothia sp.]|uniref:glucose PTS transporter subunit IIA n=1 Tax=uncultured Rothia sp. TaxID=316088 RepID=UPI003217A7EE